MSLNKNNIYFFFKLNYIILCMLKNLIRKFEISKKGSFILFIFFVNYSLSQEKNIFKQDTTSNQILNEVVVTAQLSPQSVKKSVFEVKVISKKDIQQRAANNLADLLNQTLNINITPNTTSSN